MQLTCPCLNVVLNVAAENEEISESILQPEWIKQLFGEDVIDDPFLALAENGAVAQFMLLSDDGITEVRWLFGYENPVGVISLVFSKKIVEIADMYSKTVDQREMGRTSVLIVRGWCLRGAIERRWWTSASQYETVFGKYSWLIMLGLGTAVGQR